MHAETRFVYLNSRLLPVAAAMVSVFDRGFAYGDALFETMKVSAGCPVFFDDHFQRLNQGMAEAGFSTHLDSQGLASQATSLAEVNGVEGGRLRIMLSRGTPPRPAGLDPGGGLRPTLLVTADPFAGHPPAIYREGVVCRTVRLNRGGYARLKSSGLIASVIARREAHDAGAFEAIFTDGHGRMLEGSVSNIFFHDGETLATAPGTSHILAGVTRQKVLDIAGELDIPVVYKALKVEELDPGAASAFITGSVLGICPVREIDGVLLRLDTGLTGRLSARLGELEQASIG